MIQKEDAMMFQVNDYVFYGTSGICRVDKICTDPFEGALAGVSYYILHTLSEPKQTIWNPVTNEKVQMRYVMTRKESEEFFSLLPTLPVLEGDSAKQLRDSYITAIKSGLPENWGRVMCTFRARLRLALAKLTRVTDAERNFYETARRQLANEISLALGISVSEAEGRLHAALD